MNPVAVLIVHVAHICYTHHDYFDCRTGQSKQHSKSDTRNPIEKKRAAYSSRGPVQHKKAEMYKRKNQTIIIQRCKHAVC